MTRRLAWVCVALLLACYERAPRSGPLAAIADSVIADREIQCVRNDEWRLPGTPAFATCLIPGDTSAFYYVGLTGRIYSVIRNWPAESTDATSRTLRLISGRYGQPTFAGDDGHGNTVHHWRMDSLCVSIHEPLREPFVQFNVTLPEYFAGRCP